MLNDIDYLLAKVKEARNQVKLLSEEITISLELIKEFGNELEKTTKGLNGKP